MRIEGITIDFWDTLVVAREGGAGRHRMRRKQVRKVARAGGHAADEASLERAVREAKNRFDRAWLGERHTPPTATFVSWIWELLDVEVAAAAHEETIRCFQESLLDHPPAVAEGVPEALEALARRAPLAIISDTMISPGTVLKRFLDREGLLRHFSAFVFSDESGCAKPDPRAFETAAEGLDTEPTRLVHVGDLRRTDIAGARATGAVGVLYTGVHEDPEGPEPHHRLARWRDLPELIDQVHG